MAAVLTLTLTTLTLTTCALAQATPSDCRTCHPGATKGLRASAHAVLLVRANACVTCHTDAESHAKSARDPMARRVAAFAVAANSCVQCHKDQSYAARLAAHPWRRGMQLKPLKLDPQNPNRLLPEQKLPAQLPTARQSFHWQALYKFGYRFLDITGSRDRFDTDYNLDSGFRLSEFSFDGHFTQPNPYLDRVRVDLNDLADPYEQVLGRLAKDGVYKAAVAFRRSRYKYRASGDFQRVDRKEQVASYDLTLPLGEDTEVFFGFVRSDLDGFWLTNRIGNQNLTPLFTITNVSSPRRLSEDEAELGISTHFGDTTLTIVGEYLDQNEDKRWMYSQAAIFNPAFIESEDTSSRSSLEGPGGRFNITHATDDLDVSVSTRILDRRRRIVGSGNGTGFDTAQFVTTTNSLSRGSARTLLIDGTASYAFTDDLDLHTEGRWLDHKEHLAIDQSDVTVFPTIPSTVTVQTQRDQRTVSRVREATAELQWQARKSLALTGGWGWSQEKLRLPDLESGDNDFVRGTVVEDGFILGAHWRPDAHWSARGRYRDFGQGGLQLHEITDNHTRQAEGEVKYAKDSLWYQFGVKNRRSQNPIADSRTANTSYTLSGGYAPSEDFRWHASYTLADVNSRTRTNFYFAPSPTPVSTLVGFKGETHTVHGGLDWSITEKLRAALLGSYTTVHGDFELDMYHWSIDLSRPLARGDVGIRLEQVDYHESGNPDDYDAWMTYLYLSTRLGSPK